MSLSGFLSNLSVVKEMTGSFGEWMAKNYAKIATDALVLHDVLIDGADGHTSQIDMILIDDKGIFVVEVKTFADAKIYGDGNKSKWYYYKGGRKYEIYSPIMQNRKHIVYLRQFLAEFGEIPCFSIITLICDDFKVSNVNRDAVINTVVCSSLPTMVQAIECISRDKPMAFDESKRQQIYDYILNNQHKGREARVRHKQDVKAYKQNVEELKEQKICPYCKQPLVRRSGKFGEFYGCPNYPKCRYTQKIIG